MKFKDLKACAASEPDDGLAIKLIRTPNAIGHWVRAPRRSIFAHRLIQSLSTWGYRPNPYVSRDFVTFVVPLEGETSNSSRVPFVLTDNDVSGSGLLGDDDLVDEFCTEKLDAMLKVKSLPIKLPLGTSYTTAASCAHYIFSGAGVAIYGPFGSGKSYLKEVLENDFYRLVTVIDPDDSAVIANLRENILSSYSVEAETSDEFVELVAEWAAESVEYTKKHIDRAIEDHRLPVILANSMSQVTRTVPLFEVSYVRVTRDAIKTESFDEEDMSLSNVIAHRLLTKDANLHLQAKNLSDLVERSLHGRVFNIVYPTTFVSPRTIAQIVHRLAGNIEVE